MPRYPRLCHRLARHARGRSIVLRAVWGFVESPTDPLHLVLLMKDLRASLSGWPVAG